MGRCHPELLLPKSVEWRDGFFQYDWVTGERYWQDGDNLVAGQRENTTEAQRNTEEDGEERMS
jgi:hypothetical protein